MNDSKPKKHHYVPQFIMKNFSFKKNNLFVFDKQNEKIFPSTVKNTAHENYFYQDVHEYDVETELKLSLIEGECAPIIKRILTEESIKKINEGDHRLLCLFVAIQLSRTNNTREMISDMNNSMDMWFKKSGLKQHTEESDFKKLTDDQIKEVSISILREAGCLVENLVDKNYYLIKSKENDSFYTSDHPVTMFNHIDYCQHGLALEGIEIYFPLSSRLCLAFICPLFVNLLKENLKIEKTLLQCKSRGKRLIDSVDSKNTMNLSEGDIDFFNTLQVNQSSRFIYSASGKFDLIRRGILKKEESSNLEN